MSDTIVLLYPLHVIAAKSIVGSLTQKDAERGQGAMGYARKVQLGADLSGIVLEVCMGPQAAHVHGPNTSAVLGL